MENLLKLLYLIAATAFCGCDEPLPTAKPDSAKDVTAVSMNNPDFKIVTVDSCEYVLYNHQVTNSVTDPYLSGLTHKGNCKFCTVRQIVNRKSKNCK